MSGRVTTGDSYVIAGVDGTDESYAALGFAMREAAHDGQRVMAVLAVDSSWDVEGDGDDEATVNAKARSAEQYLRAWADVHAAKIGFDAAKLEVQTVRGTGLWQLIEDCTGEGGLDVTQVVVSRRGSGPFAGWANGALPAALADAVKAPVTVVCVPDEIASTPDAEGRDGVLRAGVAGAGGTAGGSEASAGKPMVVGVDGSSASLRALRFAVREAAANRMPLEVLMCWQPADLAELDAGTDDAPAVDDVAGAAVVGATGSGMDGQHKAELVLRRMMAQVDVPAGLDVRTGVKQVAMARGMAEASHRAGWLIMGCDVDEDAEEAQTGAADGKVGARQAEAPMRHALRMAMRRVADMVGRGRHSGARWMMGHAMCVATVVG